MNKELIDARQKLLKNEQSYFELLYSYEKLKKFLDNCEVCFKKEESLESLKKINNYLKLKSAEIKELEKEAHSLKVIIYSTCEHDILITENDIFSCPICRREYINKDNDNTKFVIKYSYNKKELINDGVSIDI